MSTEPPFEIRPVTLEGQHARLEPMAPAHAEGLFLAQKGDEDLWNWMPRGPIQNTEDAKLYIDQALTRPNAFPFTIYDAKTGEVAGSSSYLTIREEHRSLEIGYTWLGSKWRRTPLNTECKLLLLTHAFETLGARRVEFKTDHRNERSQRALERIGAKYEGRLRHHMIRPDGTARDSVYYSILKAEWPAVSKHLRTILK